MEQFNTIPTSGSWADIAGILDANFLRCWTALVQSESLIGLDGSNYRGIFTSADALPEMTEPGWALVGTSLSALKLYVYNEGSTDWALLNDTTYNFTNFTEFQNELDALSSQVATIGLNLGEVITQSATGASSSIRAKVDINLPAGETIFYSYVSDSSDVNILIRFHYTDNTTENIYSGSTTLKEGSATCSKAMDYIEAVRYASEAVDGHTISLTVSGGINADLKIYKQSTNQSLSELSDGLAATNNDVVSLGEDVSVYFPEWEKGNILFRADAAWTYNNANTRVRLKENTTLSFIKGDVVGLTDYANAKYYIGWENTDGEFHLHDGWLQEDFLITEDGYYAILLCGATEATVTDVSDLSDLFFVKSLRTRVLEVDDKIGNTQSLVGTTTSGNYFLKMACNYKAGTKLLVKTSVSGTTMNYKVRFYYTDGTTQIFLNGAYGTTYTIATATKEVSHIELFSFAGVAGLTASLDVTFAIYDELDEHTVDIDNLNGSVGWRFPKEYFGIGSIAISTSGWDYSAGVKTRIRTNQGRTIHLNVGDVIGLTDWTGKRFYLGGLIDGTTYIAKGWNTSDVTITQEGEYVLCFSNTPEQNIADVSELTDYLFVKRNGGLLQYFENILTELTANHSLINKNVFSVAHRGYCQNLTAPVRPENTIASFKLARQLGYEYVETDIMITSDGKYVLCHDTTIDRTSNGSGTISEMTLSEIRGYKFGYLNGVAITGYENEDIPTLEEFLIFCRNVGLHPYLEIEHSSLTQTQCNEIVELIKDCGMDGKCSIISLQSTGVLDKFHVADENMELGVLERATDPAEITDDMIAYALTLKSTNNVFIDSHTYTATEVQKCRDAGLPLGIYTINSSATALALPSYATFITTDCLNYGKILYDSAMN